MSVSLFLERRLLCVLRAVTSLCCETLEVFYRDFLADRLSYLPHLVNVVHGIHLLNVLGIQVSDAKTLETRFRQLRVVP